MDCRATELGEIGVSGDGLLDLGMGVLWDKGKGCENPKPAFVLTGALSCWGLLSVLLAWELVSQIVFSLFLFCSQS